MNFCYLIDIMQTASLTLPICCQIMGVGEGSQGSNTQNCLARPWVADREMPLDWGQSGYNTESLTEDHSRLRVWIVPCSVHAKRHLLQFSKKSRDFNLQPLKIWTLSYPTLHTFFRGSQTVIDPLTQSFPQFYIMREWNNMLLNLFSS